MKILLLSDTHGFIDDKIIAHVKWADEVWHSGDIGTIDVALQLQKLKPLKAVYGNIDGKEIRQLFPLHNRFKINGLDVLITHIGGYPGHFAPSIKNILQTDPPKLFICGHSHILKVMKDTKFNMLCMNPGSAGISGFHVIRTMLRFTIDQKGIKDLEIIELGKRARL